MVKMEQADHIELLKKRSSTQEKKAILIQKQYLLYLEEKAETLLSDKSRAYLEKRVEFAFGELLLLLDEYCIPWVRKQLWKTGCYSDEIEDIALQDARMAVFEVVKSAIGSNQAKDNFVHYAFGIYKNKTLNAIRKELNRRNKLPTVSTEEPIGESGKKIQDILPPVPFDYGEKDDLRKVYGGVFRVYCTAFLTSKAFPPSCIALYYARVLPHLLEDILDSKATSAKWAIKRMESKSIDDLKRDSEHTLQYHVDSGLAWGGEFIRQLNDELSVSGRTVRLGDVIYTEVYDKGKTEDWAESMHKTTIKAAIVLLTEDRELFDLAKEYATNDNVLNRFMGKRGGKCQ